MAVERHGIVDFLRKCLQIYFISLRCCTNSIVVFNAKEINRRQQIDNKNCNRSHTEQYFQQFVHLFVKNQSKSPMK